MTEPPFGGSVFPSLPRGLSVQVAFVRWVVHRLTRAAIVAVIVPFAGFLGTSALRVHVFLQVRIAVCGFCAAGAQPVYVLIHARAGAG